MTRLEYIAALLEKRGIKYKIVGKTINLLCLNPEHPDTKPSMFIYPDTNTFHCFGCGFHGRIHQLFKIDRIRNFAVPILDVSDKEIQQLKDKINSSDVVEIVLPPGKRIKESIRNLDPKFLNKYMYISEKGLTFPVFWERIPVGYTYKNDKGHWIHSKGKTVYGKHFSRFPYPFHNKHRYMIIVEGVFDFLRLKYFGLNAFLTFGCNFSKEKADRIVQMLPEIVFLLYDGDKPGRSNSKKYFDYLKEFVEVYVIKLPDGEDPDSFFRKHPEKIVKLKKMILQKFGGKFEVGRRHT